MDKLSPIVASAFYRNVPVRAFVVRSLVTGKLTFAWKADSMKFSRSDAPSSSRTETLNPENFYELMDTWNFLESYIKTKGIKPKAWGERSKQFWVLLTDAVRELQPKMWAEFEESEAGDTSWHPVERVPYDWMDLAVLDVFSQAGEETIAWLKKLLLAAFGLTAVILTFVFSMIVVSAVVTPLIWLFLKYVPSAVAPRSEFASVLRTHSSWALVVVPIGVLGVMLLYYIRNWPQIKVAAWVDTLNRRRK